MIDEFITVDNEEEAPRLKVSSSAELEFYLYIESTKELSLITDFNNIPYGSICIDGRVIYERPRRSGTYIYHAELKDMENWAYWGWLLSSTNGLEREATVVLELREYLKAEGFVLFEISIRGTLKKVVEHLSKNVISKDLESKEAVSKDIKSKDVASKDDGIPYRADRLLPDDSPRSLSEHHYLCRIINGRQPLGQPEAQLLWKRRVYLARERPQALGVFLRSLDWRDDQEAALALILVAEEWHPLNSLLEMVEAINSVIRIVPKDYTMQVDQALCSFFTKRTNDWKCDSLVEELAVQALIQSTSPYERINKYLRTRVRMVHVQRTFPWADELVRIADQVRRREATRQARTNQLRSALASVPLATASPLPFYYHSNKDSNNYIVGIAAERSIVFKSNAMPVRVSLVRESDCGEVLVLVKSGEDIRNDQWLMAIFSYARTLWKMHNLPFLADCMITYGVYPYDNKINNSDEVIGGVIEYIPSQSLTDVLEKQGRIEGTERFVWSCAGYTLLTWLFGVGDRHLDNLLITSDGCLFHVDYAYLFGADPKPFAPPMKLCPEMLQALPLPYFQKIMLAALRILQNHTALLLSVVELGFGVERAAFVRERLGTGDERVKALVEESARAMMPQVMETIHKWSQYWKA